MKTNKEPAIVQDRVSIRIASPEIINDIYVVAANWFVNRCPLVTRAPRLPVGIENVGPGLASLGPSQSAPPRVYAGRVLLEVHCLSWEHPTELDSAYGKIVAVELLHKLHDELKYEGLEALQQGIARDCDDARAYFAAMHTETSRQTTRDRI